jgi:hypothetical protein
VLDHRGRDRLMPAHATSYPARGATATAAGPEPVCIQSPSQAIFQATCGSGDRG